MNNTELIDLFLKQYKNSLKGLVVGLVGTLGAGKTQTVKNLLKTIDTCFEPQVQSPTFSICNMYQSTKNSLEVHHFDLYRVESNEDLYEIEIWESIEKHDPLVLIEWVDMFPELMEKCDLVIQISLDNKGKRSYKMKKLE